MCPKSFPDIKSNVSPFLFLAVDLPPPPLFQDAVEKNIIPQVNIQSVLSKYDGVTTQESAGQLRRFKCQRLPQYIILHFKRFTKNAFVEEKNPTIVNFPLRGLDFRECMFYFFREQPDNSSRMPISPRCTPFAPFDSIRSHSECDT